MVKTVRFVNESDVVVTNVDLGLVVEPGGEVEIEEPYATPGVSRGGTRIKARIEMLCPQLKPKDPEVRMLWERPPGAVVQPLPSKPAVPKVPTVEQLVRDGYALEVAEAMARVAAGAVEDPPKKRGRAGNE